MVKPYPGPGRYFSRYEIAGVVMDLGGQWLAAPADESLRRSFPRPDMDDSGWAAVRVPGHWQSVPAFASSDGPLLYRRRFCLGPLEAGQRAWLVLEGIFYQSDVWLDGSYLGDTEGYFFPHVFDVTSALAGQGEHLLGVEVVSERPAGRSGPGALIGVFAGGNGIDPASNPGGIWGPVRIALTGPVRAATLTATCAEATAERAVLKLDALLDSAGALAATVRTELVDAEGAVVASQEQSRPLSVGANRARWDLVVPAPRLWWPIGLGDQALYDLVVSVTVDGQPSDQVTLRTGLRQVRMKDFVWRVNGERVFLRGANVGPTRQDLANATPAEVEDDVRLARDAGLNFVRAHGHVGRPELYQAADRLGVLVWQDMPFQGGHKRARRQAVRQAGKAVEQLGHHPCIIAWCGHNGPFPYDNGAGGPAGTVDIARWWAGQILPSWDRSVLDRGISRALRRADPSRPVISHSGLLPHPGGGTDAHPYFGWYHGRWDGLAGAAAAWPAAVRFIGELGAQSVPFSAGFMEPERWPDLDWDRLAAHHCLQKPLLDKYVPPGLFATFGEWRDATQAYQAYLVKAQVETIRRLKYRPTGGFAVFCLNDAQGAVSWSLLDHHRVPKAAYEVLRAACSDVLVVTDWPAPVYRLGQPVSLAAHVVNDLRVKLASAEVRASARWPGGSRRWRFAGDVQADSCAFVGRLELALPALADLPAPEPLEVGPAAPGTVLGWPLDIEIQVRWEGCPAPAVNRYHSVIKAG
jgi:beta-mannosidase